MIWILCHRHSKEPSYSVLVWRGLKLLSLLGLSLFLSILLSLDKFLSLLYERVCVLEIRRFLKVFLLWLPLQLLLSS
jgi:hypothetical protein